jgi:hypothetical protein
MRVLLSAVVLPVLSSSSLLALPSFLAPGSSSSDTPPSGGGEEGGRTDKTEGQTQQREREGERESIPINTQAAPDRSASRRMGVVPRTRRRRRGDKAGEGNEPHLVRAVHPLDRCVALFVHVCVVPPVWATEWDSSSSGSRAEESRAEGPEPRRRAQRREGAGGRNNGERGESNAAERSVRVCAVVGALSAPRCPSGPWKAHAEEEQTAPTRSWQPRRHQRTPRTQFAHSPHSRAPTMFPAAAELLLAGSGNGPLFPLSASPSRSSALFCWAALRLALLQPPVEPGAGVARCAAHSPVNVCV